MPIISPTQQETKSKLIWETKLNFYIIFFTLSINMGCKYTEKQQHIFNANKPSYSLMSLLKPHAFTIHVIKTNMQKSPDLSDRMRN